MPRELCTDAASCHDNRESALVTVTSTALLNERTAMLDHCSAMPVIPLQGSARVVSTARGAEEERNKSRDVVSKTLFFSA